jgi:hypothetical protein
MASSVLTHDMCEQAFDICECAFDTFEGAFETCEMKGLQTGEGDIGQHSKSDDMLQDLSVRLEKGNRGLCCCHNRGIVVELFSTSVSSEGEQYTCEW